MLARESLSVEIACCCSWAYRAMPHPAISSAAPIASINRRMARVITAGIPCALICALTSGFHLGIGRVGSRYDPHWRIEKLRFQCGSGV